MAKDDTDIDASRLIRETNAIANASITDVVSWDEEGNVSVMPSDEIPREAAAAIKRFRSVTR